MNGFRLGVAAIISSICLSHGALANDSTSSAASNQKTLNDLLTHIQSQSVLESKSNQQREHAFLADERAQAQLLKQAKSDLSSEKTRGDELKATFDANDKKLTQLSETLRQRSGSLGEMFGVVRQYAGEFKGIYHASQSDVLFPERGALLSKLASSKELPSSSELEAFWHTVLEQLVTSGQTKSVPATVVYGQGEQKKTIVTLVGEFNAFSNGQYVTYVPETGKFEQLSRQPSSSMTDLLPTFATKKGEYQPIYLDPSRGAILSLMVQSPTASERINQGGVVGYVILALGAIGACVALLCYLRLSIIDRKMKQQAKSEEIIAGNPLGEVIAAYRGHVGNNLEDLESKLDEIILRHAPQIQKFISSIKLVASVAPLLGLLGTVMGMIGTFQSITLFGTGDPKLMAGGISEALVTTMLGLVVAIPLLFLYSLVQSKGKRMVQILEEQSAGFIARYQEKLVAKA
ncbi:MotA/TolQ/ExbB proton channel family protein [Vibrio tritonius]|uniref:MotA/TolQ/ExbB proton channel family protein n=1 Tax=Vibrio tritonius TaxID=1435069 RepID=UPI00315D12D5